MIGTSRRSRAGRGLRRGNRRGDRPELREDRRAHGDPTNPSAASRCARSPRSSAGRLWVAAVVVPSVICAITALFLGPVPEASPARPPSSSSVCFSSPCWWRRTGRGVNSAVRSVAQLLPHRAALHTFTIAEPDSASREDRAVVDGGRRRGCWSIGPEAGNARGQACLGGRPNQLTVLRFRYCGVPIWTLLERVRGNLFATRGQCAAGTRRRGSRSSRA